MQKEIVSQHIQNSPERVFSNSELELVGDKLAEIFNLKRNREHRDRWDLGGGHCGKTSRGLTLTVLRLADDIRAGKFLE